jgi:hypothetical protein
MLSYFSTVCHDVSVAIFFRKEVPMDAYDAKHHARIAGVLILVSAIAGGLGESYIPEKLLVANSAAETAQRVAASIHLLRFSFASYLIEAACDLALTTIFYLLLKPVNRTLSLLTFSFGLFSTATFAVGEIFYYAAGLPVIDADVARALTSDARVAFTYMCLTMYGYVFAIFAGFYGTEVLLRGYLIFRSGYLPRLLGIIVMIGGAGFMIKNAAVVLAPQYDSGMLLIPMFVAMLSMAGWFLIKGVDASRWDKMNS